MTAPILAISRRIRATPFTERVEAHGVRAYTVYNHMLLPAAFRSLEEDYWHLRRHVQLWDVSCERQVQIEGPDAARLLQWMTPRDLGRLESGVCAYAPLVDQHGGMINDPVVLKLDENRFWLSIADSDVFLWAAGLASGLGLDVEVTEPDVFPLAVQGPKAEELMARVFGDSVRDIGFFRFTRLNFAARPLIVARSGWSRQGGFEIYLDTASLGGALWDALWTAGRDLQVGAGCPNLIERIESGLLSYGTDMTRANTPFECGLDRYCHLDGPDFLGRDALRAARARGPERRIRGVRFSGERAPACTVPWPLRAGVEFTNSGGCITAAAWSPRLETNVAIAMIERNYWEPGTEVMVEIPGGTRERGVVCDLPFA